MDMGSLLSLDIASNPSRTYGDYRTNEGEGAHHTYKTRGKKVLLVHSLAPALTLTLTLNHMIENDFHSSDRVKKVSELPNTLTFLVVTS